VWQREKRLQPLQIDVASILGGTGARRASGWESGSGGLWSDYTRWRGKWFRPSGAGGREPKQL